MAFTLDQRADPGSPWDVLVTTSQLTLAFGAKTLMFGAYRYSIKLN